MKIIAPPTSARFASILIALLTFVWFSGAIPSTFAAEETLNNASIIELQGLELDDAVIIEKIKTSKCDFDTSVAGLQKLKAAKVSNKVIAAMLATKAAKAVAPAGETAAPAAAGNMDDPATQRPSGIWALQTADGQKKMVRLESELPASSTSGVNPWAMGWGATAKSRANLNGAQATVQLTERRPTFYFYLGAAQGGLGASPIIQSPKEAVLAQMETSKTMRSVVTGSINAYAGASTGIEQRALRLFDFETVGDGIYKVTPQKDLANGEYAFGIGASMQGGRFYTFGIRSTQPYTREPDPAVLKLAESLQSKDDSVVEKTLKQLREMDAPEAVPLILPCLKRSHPNVIRDACRTLAVLGNKDVIPHIEPLLKHSRSDVKKDAREAIEKLQDKP